MFLLSTVHREHFAVQARVTGFDRYLDRPYEWLRSQNAKGTALQDAAKASPRFAQSLDILLDREIPLEDRKRFFVSPKGVTLVTAEMLGQGANHG